MNKNIFFVSEFSPLINDRNYSIIIPSISDEYDLHKYYNEQAKFPYFGYNWDSLSELMEDFFWILQPNIHIYHESIALLKDDDLVLYLKIVSEVSEWWDKYLEFKLSRLYEWIKQDSNLQLSDIYEWWKANPGHNLSFYFNEKDQKRIEGVLHRMFAINN